MTQQVTVKATFPSVDWFRAIAEMVTQDEGFRRLGTCDTVMGLKVPDLQKYYKLVFEAFEVGAITEVSEAEAEDSDFWLELTYAKWKEMLENIRQHGAADLHHTLNTIDIEEPEGFARSHDGYRRDAFYRFNQTFQYFFDASARIDTSFV
jgi:hypothetical protein